MFIIIIIVGDNVIVMGDMARHVEEVGEVRVEALDVDYTCTCRAAGGSRDEVGGNS